MKVLDRRRLLRLSRYRARDRGRGARKTSPRTGYSVLGTPYSVPGPRRGWRYLLVVVLGGLLLLAHIGCHGDEDNELFAVTVLKG
jgi:hypothetical protein